MNSALPGAVTFDVDGTLYVASAVRMRFAVRNLLQLRAVRVARRVREELRGQAFETGAAYFRVETERIAERLELTTREGRALIDDLFGHRLCQVLAKVGPAPGARAALEGLVAAGVPIAAVSDYPVDDKLSALGLSDLPWAACVAADEAGALKPHPRAFRIAAERVGVEPSRIVHIGDRADTDSVGARDAGMRAILIGPGGDVPSLAAAVRLVREAR